MKSVSATLALQHHLATGGAEKVGGLIVRGYLEFLNAFKVATNKDRKSTRLNSSHSQISYAVFCLKKKKKANIFIELSQLLPAFFHSTHANSLPILSFVSQVTYMNHFCVTNPCSSLHYDIAYYDE